MPTDEKKVTRKVFVPEHFVKTHLCTQEHKAQCANEFVDFVTSDFPEFLWKRRLYQFVSNSFGFIAENDNRTFYWRHFSDLAAQRRFLEQVVEWDFYSPPDSSFSDVERALQVWLRQQDIIRIYAAKALALFEAEEKKTLARLIAKYPNIAKTLVEKKP